MITKTNFLITVIFVILLPFTSYLLFPALIHAQALTPDQKARLEQELAQVEAEQKQAEKDLISAQGQSASLQKDITVLTAKIKVAQLNIRAKNLLIESLGKDIKTKETYIIELEDRIDNGRDTLAAIMRKTNEIGSYSLPEVILSQSSVTGFFKDIDSFESVQQGLKTTFEQIRSDKTETETEKTNLDKRRSAEVDARYAIQQEEKSIKANETEKQRLLNISKGNEKSYATLLAEKRTKAAQIRAALFQLRDANPIPFGDALKYAQVASAKTGVRPAFVLAILTQESALGANVGSCYLTNPTTGAGVSKKTGNALSNVMKPGRDVEPFLEIIKNLDY